MITAEQVREILDYDPATGVFVWRKRISQKSVVGRKAGTLNKGGYVVISIYGHRYYAHRLAVLHMTGTWPPHGVDHRNRNPSDNSWVNLRQADQTSNNGNMRRPRHNRSGMKGVYWDSHRDKWHAQISIANRSKSLGRFSDIRDAQAAYAKAALEHFGEFARLA